jgi:CRISPR-associated protein Cas5d
LLKQKGLKMQYNSISYKVTAHYALITDPVSHLGGEKSSYSIPTYESLLGLTKSIYWKPTFEWIIDRIRIMNLIKTTTKGIKGMSYISSGKDVYMQTYLCDVEYQVEAHFIWNDAQPQFTHDRNENKHWIIANRMLSRGGKFDTFLGTRECEAHVEPVVFGSGKGAYDNEESLPTSLMFYGFDYPTPTMQELHVKFWVPQIKNGVVVFPDPQDPILFRHKVKNMEYMPCAEKKSQEIIISESEEF